MRIFLISRELSWFVGLKPHVDPGSAGGDAIHGNLSKGS